MHFFTSITANYLPKARVLVKTLKENNPQAFFSLIIADNLPDNFNLEQEQFDEVLTLTDLNMPVDNLEQWIFKHAVVEMCTAIKGQALFKFLTERKSDKVVYVDPDMVVLHSLHELEMLLDRADIVLTPHQTIPEETREAICDNEICSMKHGIYNFGFLAVKNSPEGVRFATWWRDRLVDFCYDDIPNGLFTDQRWGDLVPALFEGVHILKDKTYNVATWNLTHRTIYVGGSGKYLIDGSPLKIYHFSGFDSGAQESMLKKYGNSELLFNFRNWYIDQQNEKGQILLGKTPYSRGFYSNGVVITKEQRVLYRNRIDLQNAFPHPDIDYLAWYEANV